MDKKSKEALRRYKKSRQKVQSTSDSSSSDDSASGSSYSSSESDRKAQDRRRKKKARLAATGVARRSSSSSDVERRRQKKREHCQKKLEAKRNHLKRKLKEAKLKKRAAAAAAAALSGHTHRALSPATQLKLKKLAERKHLRAASKERREREKHRLAIRERERDQHRIGGSRSPAKITKIRIHQDVKRQKSPPRMHHQLMSREKLIIQTRTRDRTPSVERDRLRQEHKLRHDELLRERERRERERDRAEREAARDKERAEALARCQERQRERERIAREKMRREEEEKKYGSMSGSATGPIIGGDRLLPRPAEREIAIAAARGYNSRERSLEPVDRTRHPMSKRELDVFDREREFLEVERRGLLDRDELRREREYAHRRELSPAPEHYSGRMRRDVYPDDERERSYNRTYDDDKRQSREADTWGDSREREMHDVRETRDFREMEHEIYPEDRERLARERTLAGRGDWKNEWETRDREWKETPASVISRGGFIGGPKRGGLVGAANNIPSTSKLPPREQRESSEPDWDADELQDVSVKNTGKNTESNKLREGGVPNFGSNVIGRESWNEQGRNLSPAHEKAITMGRAPDFTERRWNTEWREGDEGLPPRGNPMFHHHHRGERGGRGFRRGGMEHSYRHPPPLMTLPVLPPGVFHGINVRFPNKRNMTYTNPNLIKKQQAALAAAKAAAQSAVAAATAVAAAKAAAQSAANSTTNPGILGQVTALRLQLQEDNKPEAGEIVAECEKASSGGFAGKNIIKVSGELSEISDSDDDILNKAEKKLKEIDEVTTKTTMKQEQESVLITEAINDTIVIDEKPEDDEMLDFEEISDGELEEEARNKGVGDALGVDWASLIAETKAASSAPSVSEPTTAKQRWQPHRIILEIGVSMRMAGEEYAKQVLNDARQKLEAEQKQQQDQLQPTSIKSEIKEEKIGNADEDSQTVMDTIDEQIKDEETEDKKVVIIAPELKAAKLETTNSETIILEYPLHPLACVQVAERKQLLEQRNLIVNACGARSRALSAHQDLRLRRQLCGLPARELDIPRPLPETSAKLKAKAMAAFQRTLAVK